MKKFSVFMLALSLAVGISSCGSSGGSEPADTEKPRITIEKPLVNQEVKAGEAVQIKVAITDNKALKNWKYDIVLTTPVVAKKNNDDWAVTGTAQALSGASASKEASETSKATGKLGIYTLTVTAVDAAGNIQTATRVFKLIK